MKKHIKAFAALCSMAMVFSIFSAVSFAADPDTTSLNQQYVTDNNNKLPVVSGNYVLTEDISVSESSQIEEDRAVISIDLNGHTITYSGSESMYIVGKVSGTNIQAGNVHLTISDSSNGSGLITTASGYTGGGSIDHWISYNNSGMENNERRGGCILLQITSTFTLAGGTINGFYAKDEGGAVHVSNGSTFIMTGGTISGCSSKNGGAVAVHTASGGRNNMYSGINIAGYARLEGGTITGNKATNGGAVRVQRGDLYLGSCVITGNTSTGSGDNGGGGIAIAKPDNYTQYLEIGGSPEIYGNTGADANRSDLFFAKNATFTLTSDMASTAKISFGAKSWSTTHKYFNVNGKSYDIGSFTCSNDSYEPYYNSSNDSILVRTITKPAITGCNVSVSGSILLNAQLTLGSYDDDNASVTYAYSYTKKGTVKNVSKTLSRSELGALASGNYTLTIPVEASCMTSPIEITIAYGTDGRTVSKTVTIEDYAKAIMNNTSGTYSLNEKDAAKALITYGGYAQVQLQINTDKLPTVDGVDFNSAFADNIQGAAYTITKDTNGAYYGVSVSFLSETNVKMYFKKSVLGDTAPDMNVTYSAGGSETISGKTNGGYYEYTIKGPNGTGFAATQYKAAFDFSIGEDISGTYSVDTYLKAIKNNSNSAAAMKNLAEAYYNFALKCLALA